MDPLGSTAGGLEGTTSLGAEQTLGLHPQSTGPTQPVPLRYLQDAVTRLITESGPASVKVRFLQRDILTSKDTAVPDLMDTDVAFVTEDHLVAVLPLGRPADVAHHVLVVLDAEAFLRLDGLLHLLLTHALELHQNTLHGQLVQLWQGWRVRDIKRKLISFGLFSCVRFALFLFYAKSFKLVKLHGRHKAS